MKQEPVIVETIINAPIDKVWKALTDKAQITQWYFDIPDFKPELGFEFEFSGKGKEGEDYLHKCKITEVIPSKKLTHSWRYEGYEGDSLVMFELTAEGDKTNIMLTHKGLETFPPVSAFAKENFREGWNYIIGTALKTFVER